MGWVAMAPALWSHSLTMGSRPSQWSWALEVATAALGGAPLPSTRAPPSLLWQGGAEVALSVVWEAMQAPLGALALQEGLWAATLVEEGAARLLQAQGGLGSPALEELPSLALATPQPQWVV